MASYAFKSVIEFSRKGNSKNFGQTGNNSNADGVMTDGSPGDFVFEYGELVTLNTGGSSSVTAYFGGIYTKKASDYVWLYDTPDLNTATKAYLVSTEDIGPTLSDLNGRSVSSVRDVDSSDFVVCFARGTLIATPAGEMPVEQLAIGDTILTASGATVPVKWIGRQTVSTRFRAPERLGLVRIAAGALGNGLPRTDLTVTSDHALLLDGVLCHAGALVNGTTVARLSREDCGERYTVYHVETEAHDIILANGVAAETFIDNAARAAFDNADEFTALYGPSTDAAPLLHPRAKGPRQVPASVRSLLASRAAA